MYIYNVYSVKLNNEVTIRRIIVWIQPSNINQDSSKTSMYPFLQTLKEQNSKWVPNNHQSIYCLCNWRPWCLLFDERVPQNLPSRERTYPLPRHFWRWFSFSPGGNMSSFPEVYHQNFFSKSKNPILHAAPNVFQRTRPRVAGMMVLIAAGQWNVPWETVGIGLPIFTWFLVHVMFQS